MVAGGFSTSGHLRPLTTLSSPRASAGLMEHFSGQSTVLGAGEITNNLDSLPKELQTLTKQKTERSVPGTVIKVQNVLGACKERDKFFKKINLY